MAGGTAGRASQRPHCDVAYATSDDADAIDMVMLAAHQTNCETQFEMSASELLRQGRQTVLLARVDRDVIGCIMADCDRVAVIHTLGVVAAHRGRRYSTLMIKALVNELERRTPPPTVIWTAVNPKSGSASDRFTLHGFVDSGRRIDGLILMIKRIQQ